MSANANLISSVSLPEETPLKWDLADPLPEGWSPLTLQKLLSPSLDLSSVFEVLGKYQLSGFRCSEAIKDPGFANRVEKLHTEMIQWQSLLGIPPTAEGRLAIAMASEGGIGIVQHRFSHPIMDGGQYGPTLSRLKTTTHVEAQGCAPFDADDLVEAALVRDIRGLG